VFADQHSELTMDVELSGRVVDLADEGVDIAVWNGQRRDSTIVARKLCHVHYVTVASPQYLARYGEPETPADLQRHRCLGYFFPHVNRYREWNFVDDGEPVAHHVSGSLNINNGPALLAAAIGGAGIAMVAAFLAADAVRDGRLKVILRDFIFSGPTFWIGHQARRHVSLRVRTLVDFLTLNVPARISEEGIVGMAPARRAPLAATQ
jgi:LysR family transcriptional regulator for bpeEF and oprC